MENTSKILTFDSELHLQKIFEKHLSTKEYHIQFYNSSKELLQQLSIEKISLVFFNLAPNDPAAEQLLQKIKRIYPDCLLILIIDPAGSADTLQRLQNIFFDYLKTPISAKSLYNVFFNALHYQNYQKKKIQISNRLHYNKDRCRRITESMTEGYFEADVSGRITFANNSIHAILGYPPNKLIGQNSNDLFPSKDARKIKLFFNRIHRYAQPQNYHGGLSLKSGQKIHIRASISRIHCNSQPTGYAGIIRDVTAQTIAEREKSQLESQLHQSQKMEAIGTLAGGIAHDFNNILSAIMGYTELSLQDLPNDTILHNNLNRILNAGERARDLVRQILTFSRQTDKAFTLVSIQPIVREALRLLRASLPATIQIQSRIDQDAVIMADPTQIHQILINLCTNASHAMQERGGILNVTSTHVNLDADFCQKHPDIKPGIHLQIRVADTGMGIPASLVKRIFDPFFTTKAKEKGTGMGLAVVHGIVKSHKGTIIVDSKLGQGTIFDIFFPIVSNSKGARTLTSETAGSIPTGNERILFVDDERVQKDLAKKMLERLGYRVTTRDCGQRALALFHRDPDQFDLVITDMTMPRMTGDILAKEIMQVRPEMPIIICTGYSEKLNEKKALSMGAKGFMMKPITIKEMATLIRNILPPV